MTNNKIKCYRVLAPKDKKDTYLEFFRKRQWEEIKKLKKTEGLDDGIPSSKWLVISPFSSYNLTPFSYDLSLGKEIYSIQKGKLEQLPYQLQPAETVVVLTKELIAIPHLYAATIWPRFNMVRKGIFQSMVKIDPTWYGKLGVTITNASPTTIELNTDEAFATLLFYELTSPSDVDLWRPEELKTWVEVQILEEFVNWAEDINTFCKENRLHNHYCVKDGKISVKDIKRNQIEALKLFNDSEAWHGFVETVADKWSEAKHTDTKNHMIGMSGLGMESLRDLEKLKYGTRLKKEDVDQESCREDDLVDAAVQYGKPFNLLAQLPNMLARRIDSEIAPRIKAEVETSIFPRIVLLTFTTLGFITLIVAVLRWCLSEFSSTRQATSATLPWVTTIIAAIIIIVGFISFSRWTRPEISKDFHKRYKTLEDKLKKMDESFERVTREGGQKEKKLQ